MDDLAQFVGLLVSVTTAIVTIIAATLGFLYKEMKEWRRETKTEIEDVKRELQRQAERTDQTIERIDQEIQIQSQRSDKLYEMFIDLLKNPPPPKTNS